jgi:RNA polymerase sigma-70 factor (ECF subfamily)
MPMVKLQRSHQSKVGVFINGGLPRTGVDYKKFDDEVLVRLIAQAQSEALGELYDRYSRLVFSLALRAVGNQGIAEEVTQDTFLRIWERASTYRSDQGKVVTWMLSITRNRSIDILRYQKVRPDAHSISWDENPFFDPAGTDNVEGEAESRQQRHRVRQALLQLPEEQRAALALAYFKGYTQEQIAVSLGEPLGTVKTRIRLAMQKLRQLLKEDIV